jgi:CheY-like chemotaxis protein
MTDRHRDPTGELHKEDELMENLPRLLLVDDEERFRETLAKRLKETGYEVEGAGSGMEALDILSSEKFDIVVMDIQMPGLSGIETLSEIRAKHIGVEVIIASSPPQNGNLLRQRKNPDRLCICCVSVIHCAPWIFSLPCISPFLNRLRIMNFSTVSKKF